MIGVFFVSTAWGRKNGGINSINYALVKSMANIIKKENSEWKIHCIITDIAIDDEEEDLAKEDGIILKSYKNPIASKGLSRYVDNENFDQIFWIGHDVITGSIVNKLAEKHNNSMSIIIHHMSYETYYYVRNKNPEKIRAKENLQASILPMADIVFTIGPVLYESAADIINNCEQKKVKTIKEIIPGLEEIKPNEYEHKRHTIIFFGRIEENNNMLKQTDLVIDAIATYIKNRPELSSKIIFKIYGYAEDSEGNQTEIMNKLFETANRNVNGKAFKYIEKTEDLFKEIKNSSLCIMPSLEEGFGLVAYEAIAAGVPVIISKSSGLYQFLEKRRGGSLIGNITAINIEGNPNNEGKNYTENDLKNLETAISNIFANYSLSKHNALLLREELLKEHYTWDYCAREILATLKEYNTTPNIKKNDIEIKSPIMKRNKNLSEYLNETILPGFCSLVGTKDTVQCKIIKYSNDRSRRFTVFSSNHTNGGQLKTRQIDAGTVGVMNILVADGYKKPIVITDFIQGNCYCITENNIELVDNANYGSPDHHVLFIISVPIFFEEELVGALTFDIFDDFSFEEKIINKDLVFLNSIHKSLQVFTEVLVGYFYHKISDDIKFNEERNMIMDRVLVSFGGKCKLGCKHCFAQDLKEEYLYKTQDVVNSIRQKNFDVIYVSHNNENFYKPEEGVRLCEELYEAYKKDICITTRCILNTDPLDRIKRLSKRMKEDGNMLTFCISIPALESYERTENCDCVPTPMERISFAKKLQKIGITSLITIRPLFPNSIIDISEAKRIIDLAGDEVDGFLTGGLIVTENIMNKLSLCRDDLEFLDTEETDYLKGVEGEFLHINVEKEIDELEQYCAQKNIPFFRHSMEALNFFRGLN